MREKIYIGVDPSFTNTGIVVLERGKFYTHGIKIPVIEDDTTGQTSRILKGYPELTDALEFTAIMTRDSDAICGIEIPMGNHFGNGAIIERAYTMCIFAVDEVARQYWNSLEFITYYPSQLKKFIGKGLLAEAKDALFPDKAKLSQAQKKKLAPWAVNKRFNFETKSHDIAEAYFGAMMVKLIDEGKYEL